MRKIGKILGILGVLLFGVASASAGEFFIPEGLTLINGFLYQLAPVVEQVGLYIGEAHEPINRTVTGLMVGGGY